MTWLLLVPVGLTICSIRRRDSNWLRALAAVTSMATGVYWTLSATVAFRSEGIHVLQSAGSHPRYGEAFRDGAIAVQKYVDTTIPGQLAAYICLAILALTPALKLGTRSGMRRNSDKKNGDSGHAETSAHYSPPNPAREGGAEQE